MDNKEVDYELVVCGGGIPGVCAAVTAARRGVRVALLENRPILGGNGSSLALVPPHGAASFWHNRMAREGGILEEVMIEYAARSPLADNRRIFDMVLHEWCTREASLDLFMNTRGDSVE
ncbi:MAG: FAD-dependent oxidoreductase, partial [Opitutales bacterium]|nr:FAD-dependent oxidoreductase [Opitutales bacterium]